MLAGNEEMRMYYVCRLRKNRIAEFTEFVDVIDYDPKILRWTDYDIVATFPNADYAEAVGLALVLARLEGIGLSGRLRHWCSLNERRG